MAKKLVDTQTQMASMTGTPYRLPDGQAATPWRTLAWLADYVVQAQGAALAAGAAALKVARQAQAGDIILLEDAEHEALCKFVEQAYAPQQVMYHSLITGVLNALTQWLRSATDVDITAAPTPGA